MAVDARRSEVARLGRGRFFGEISVLDGRTEDGRRRRGPAVSVPRDPSRGRPRRAGCPARRCLGDARDPGRAPCAATEINRSRSGSSGEPGRPCAGLVPQHGEERFVHRQVAVASVARVVQVDVRLVEPGLGRQHVRDQPHPSDGSARVRCRPVPRGVVVERASARLDDDGHVSIPVPSGAAARAPASQSSGAWNCDRTGADRGQWFEPRTYSIGPASAAVSCSAIQHVTISGGTR